MTKEITNMSAPFVRNPYNYDMNKAGDESGLNCKDKSLTQQSFKDEVDINTIVERFGLTGEVPQVLAMPTYGDFTGIFDFQTAMNTVRHAQEAFLTLPANIRQRYNNDPQRLLEALQDDANRDELTKLGILTLPPKEGIPVETPTPPAVPAKAP